MARLGGKKNKKEEEEEKKKKKKKKKKYLGQYSPSLSHGRLDLTA